MITRNAVIVSISVVLLLVSVALIVLSGKKEVPEEVASQANESFAEAIMLTTFGNISVQYVVKDSVTFNNAEIHVWTEWIDDVCGIEIQKEYSRNLSPHKLARIVAGCHTQLMEFETPEEATIFETAYADLYVSRCGDIFQPLGWKNATDGECEPPSFGEITIY
jgi:hypothetical protein